MEWIFHQSLDQVTNVEVAAQWHEHYREFLKTENETSIKLMAVCFFYLCQAAELGQLVIGRRGSPTRLEVNKGALGQFIGEAELDRQLPEEAVEVSKEESGTKKEEEVESPPFVAHEGEPKSRIFIAHSKNLEIVDQVKTMLELADLDHEIAEEEEETAIPVPDKVLSAMRRCTAAIICVTADESEKRDDGEYGINQNVLVEIGAAFVLYDKKVVLLWDKRVPVPSNLQGLYRCEYSGDELSWSAGMKLMKAVNKFKK